MPTIEVNKKDLEQLIGKKFSKTELEDTLLYVKGELDDVQGDMLKIDVKETNRPDLWSTEGIAREIKTRLGLKKRLKKIKVKKSKVKIIIDKNLEKTRPLIACAIIKNIKITEDLLIQLIQLQEKIGLTFGRKRKEVAIGIYDFDKMTPPIYYKGFKNNEIEFIPLEWKVPMKPSEILLEHEKGKEYAHLLENTSVYPIVIDSKNTVASMPPIINSQTTGKVTSETKNLFLEVTGFNWRTINTALEVMTMALEDRGGEIYSTEIIFPKGKNYPKNSYTPEFKTLKKKLDLKLIKKITGLELKNKEIIELFEKSGFNPTIKKTNIELEYPAYRQDIMHPVDFIEDLLISYGYNNIEPEPIDLNVQGKHLKKTIYIDKVRDVCVGLGLQEILTFNLTSKQKQNTNLGLNEEFVEISNPVSQNWQIMRKRLTPELLEFLNKNKRFDYPQKIFEIGTTLELNPKKDNGVNEHTKLCIVLTGKKFEFNQAKSILQAITQNLGIEFKLQNSNHPFLDKEKQATIIMNNKKGFLGEINKKTLKNFGLENPTIIIEIEV